MDKETKGEFPNKATQFTSTNQPAKRGRNKGSRNVSTVLKELLSEQDKTIGGVGDFGAPLARMLIKIAFGKDSTDNDKLKAIREILDRIEGKAEQNIRIGSQSPTWLNQEESDNEHIV